MFRFALLSSYWKHSEVKVKGNMKEHAPDLNPAGVIVLFFGGGRTLCYDLFATPNGRTNGYCLIITAALFLFILQNGRKYNDLNQLGILSQSVTCKVSGYHINEMYETQDLNI